MYFHGFYKKLSLFPKEKHTLSKMSRVSIKMTAVKLIKVSLFPKELSTFSTINHVSIKMTAVNLIKVSLFPKEIRICRR